MSEQQLSAGSTIRHEPSLLCYEEAHPQQRATVHFAVEGSVRQDSWGRYPRMVRQLLVAWGSDGDAWEVRFVTDPRADARGITLWKRDGVEVLELRRTKGGALQSSRWALVSKLDGTSMSASHGNPVHIGNARMERLMERMRNIGYRAHRQLEGYIVDSDQPPNANPRVIDDDDLAHLIQIVTELASDD